MRAIYFIFDWLGNNNKYCKSVVIWNINTTIYPVLEQLPKSLVLHNNLSFTTVYEVLIKKNT